MIPPLNESSPLLRGFSSRSRSSSPEDLYQNSPGRQELHLSMDNITTLCNTGSFYQRSISSGSLSQLSPPQPPSVFQRASSSQHEELFSSVLDPYFDMSTLGVIFNALDTKQQGHISYDELKEGLNRMGIHFTNHEHAFHTFVQFVDTDHTRTISRHEFQRAVQRIKLADVFPSSSSSSFGTNPRHALPPPPSLPLTLVEYSANFMHHTLVSESMDTLQAFFFSEEDPESDKNRMQWISVFQTDEMNIKRLQIKYGLHPLAVEDVLENHERSKCDVYDDHFFIVFPVVQLVDIESLHTEQREEEKEEERVDEDETIVHLRRSNRFSQSSSASFRKRKSSKRPQEQVELNPTTTISIEHVSIFVLPVFRVIITMIPPNGSSSDVPPRSMSSHYSTSSQSTRSRSKRKHWSEEFMRRLDTQLRQKNSFYFGLYGILDSIVDQMSTVMDDLTQGLMQLEDQVDQEQHHFQVAKLRQVKQLMYTLPRIFKPAKEVLKNLMEQKETSHQDATLGIYLRDVHDHVIHILDTNELQWQLCRSLTEDYREAKANQMNYVIYCLTIVTTVFLPAQFLTGVYGMNFEYMPELHEKYGYYFFWIFVIMIATGLHLYFRFKQWI